MDVHPAPPSRRRHQPEMSTGDQPAATRVDRWLWAARAFRSRSLATQACNGGRVSVNGTTAKPHKLVRLGDLVEITVSGDKRHWRVVDIAEQRGPASVARTLYDDLTPPPRPEPVDTFIPRRDRGTGRPTKRERRQLDRFR